MHVTNMELFVGSVNFLSAKKEERNKYKEKNRRREIMIKEREEQNLNQKGFYSYKKKCIY